MEYNHAGNPGCYTSNMTGIPDYVLVFQHLEEAFDNAYVKDLPASEGLPRVARIQNAAGDSVSGQPVMYGAHSEREIRSRENKTHSHQILLDQGARG
jgi:hypothetical protein